jgi:PAS domain S-box-containing protein
MSQHLPVRATSPESLDAEPYVRHVLDAIPQLAWRAFADGSVEFCNQSWIEYTGLTAQQAQGWGWRAAIHPDDLDGLVATWHRILEKGISGEAEARMRAADGTFRWFLIRGMPLRDDQGRIVRWYGTNIDIDERKRGEQRLRESDERFRLAAQAGKMFAYEWDAATDLIVRSSESALILGINEGEPITGQQIFAKVYPYDRERLAAAMAELSPKKPHLQVSYRMVRPDGTVIWVDRNSRAHFDHQGKLLRIVGMVADATERKRAEAALRESEERLRLAVKAGRMYAFEWDAVTDVIVRGGECTEILYWMDDPTRDTGRHFVASVHPDDRGAYSSLEDGHTPENSIYETNYRVLRPDGSLIWLEARGHASFDDKGKLLRIMGMVVDVTERRNMEEALRESEERLRMAAQAGRMYAYEWDVASDKVVRSVESADLLGFGSPTHTTRLELLNCAHPDDHGLCGDLSTVTPQSPGLRVRYRTRRQDGTWMWAEKTARAFFDDQGRMVRMIGMIADITERKLTEETLSKVSRRLIEAQEQERLRIALELHDDLSQRIALLQIGLEQFVQNMPELTSNAKEQLHHISQAASEVSSDLHSMAYQLHPRKLDLLGLVATVGSFCREMSRQQDLRIEFVHHDVGSQIPKDVAMCLFRIVQEALRNVVKHSGTAEAKVELSGDGDKIDLCISDRGVGFDPNSEVGQAGLGLVSVRERVRLVGGHLSVESQPSHGSRIRVRVPLLVAHVQATSEGEPQGGSMSDWRTPLQPANIREKVF